MDSFIQLAIQSVAVGSMYSLLALGYNLIYSTMNMAHYAQGDFMMVSAYFMYLCYVSVELPFALSMILAIVGTVLFMLFVEHFLYAKMYKKNITLLITTIGFAVFLRAIVQLIFTAVPVSFDTVFGGTSIEIGSVLIVPQYLWITGIGLVLMVLLSVFMKKTKMGTAMRAVAMNRDAAALMGIRMTKITFFTYGIAAALAAVAGVLLAPIYKIYPTMGASIGGKVMIASAIGGMGDVSAAMLGGILLGIIETMGGAYISTQYKEVFGVLVLYVILMFRPQGLLGQKKIMKV